MLRIKRFHQLPLEALPASPGLADFWDMAPASREQLLVEAIAAAHTHHFENNTAYRTSMAARDVGMCVQPEEMPRLLRPTSQAFRSYVELLGTTFPQGQAMGFVHWLIDQSSVELNVGARRMRSRYRSLEALLRDTERTYPGLRLQMLTSSGASGRSALVPRSQAGMDLAARSFALSFQRYFGVTADHLAVFMTPQRTRVATARMARIGLGQVGLTRDRVHFATPFPEYPDQARIRAGRHYRPGWRGELEHEVWHPILDVAQKRLLDPRAVESAVSRLIPASAHGEKVLLFGSLSRLYEVARFLLESGRTVTLAPGSLLVTGGRPKAASAAPPEEMRQALLDAFTLTTGEPVPIRDVYSLAEANWAAMQCAHGSYHLPPWLYAVTVDDADAFQTQPQSTGLLAFFDPFGGGDLYPSFFRTADQVTLVRGTACPCGEAGDYIAEGSIRRIDLPGEAAWVARA
jgi:hypothetical protein